MSVTDLAHLLDQVSARAATDPDAVIPVLMALAGEPHDDTPAWRATVIEINRDRLRADRAAFQASSWTTDRVAAHLGVTSRQAIAQRRMRGSLLGVGIDRQTYYPEWQFDAEGVVPSLPRLLGLLRDAGLDDARAADDALRMTHSGLGGGTLLDAWRAGDWATLASWLGDVGAWRR